MTFTESITSAFKNYANFKGRASRSEFWWFTLFEFLVLLHVTIFEAYYKIEHPIITGIFAFALFLPDLTMCVRRCHDSNHSGWWVFCPIVNNIMMFLPSKPEPTETTGDEEITDKNLDESTSEHNLQNYIDKLAIALDLTRKNYVHLSKAKRDLADKQFYSEQLHYDDEATFKRIVNRELNNFYDKISQEFNLSAKEIQLAVFYLLELPDYTICLLMDYSYNSLATMKTRLSKKLLIENASLLPEKLIQIFQQK